MKVVLSGGGTLGPVVPLLAIVEAVKSAYPNTEFVWMGTKNGPEQEVVQRYGIPFFVVGGGKWRRYFSFWNLADFFKLIAAFFRSLFLLAKIKPDLLITAGGFVSVPVHYAGAVLGVPAWVHQQDARPGLANKLMAPWAQKITTALKASVSYFPAAKTEWLGNPVRDLRVESAAVSRQKFDIPLTAPVIFALGGGTGSAKINQLMVEALQQLPPEWHVIHLTGRERSKELPERASQTFPNYQVHQFFNEEMKDAYAAADVVVARAGFATITELAALGKAAILVPMSGTHQEDNARFLSERQAVITLDERSASGLDVAQAIKNLIADPAQRAALGRRLNELLPAAKAERVSEIIDGLVKK